MGRKSSLSALKNKNAKQINQSIDRVILLGVSGPVVPRPHCRLVARLSRAPSSSSDARASRAFNPPSVLDDPILVSFSRGYGDGDRVLGDPPPTPSDWKVNSGYGEGWDEWLSELQIRTAPS